MKLQEKLDVMKKESLAKMPEELVKTLVEGMQELMQSGIAERAIKVGEALPEFVLPNEKGEMVESRSLLAKGPLALSFYRGIW